MRLLSAVLNILLYTAACSARAISGWLPSVLCFVGQGGILSVENCNFLCVNETNLATGQTIYSCGFSEHCLFGKTCENKKEFLNCCCNRDFCNAPSYYLYTVASTQSTSGLPTSTRAQLSTTRSTSTTASTLASMPTRQTHATRHSTFTKFARSTRTFNTKPRSITTTRPATTEEPPFIEPTLVCFTGVTIGFLPENRWTTGALLACEGVCTNITLAIFYVPVTAYICDVNTLCRNWDMNTCDYISQDTAMTVCCCDASPTCNVAPATPLPSPIPSVTYRNDTKNTCFIGFAFINSIPVTLNVSIPANFPVGKFELCDGNCANITLGSFGTLYTCDPISVCVGLTLQNRCNDIVPGLLSGCCCFGKDCNLVNNTQVDSSTEATTQKQLTISSSAIILSVFFIHVVIMLVLMMH